MTLPKRFWLIFLLILISSTAIGLYYASPYIAHYGLQRWLTQQQFSHVELDMAPPQWGQLQVHNLRLSHEHADQTTHIATGPILIRFDPIVLLTQQRLQLIELPHAQITLHQHSPSNGVDPQLDSQPNQQRPATQLDLSQLLPATIFAQLPVEQLRIGQVELALNYPAPDKNWHISGALQLDKRKLYAHLKFKREAATADAAEQTWTDLGWADIEIDSNNAFHLRLLEDNTPFLVVSGSLSADDTLTLSSTQVVTLQGIRQWLSKFSPDAISALPTFIGSITSSGVSHFPVTAQLSPDALFANMATRQAIQSQFRSSDLSAYGLDQHVKKLSAEIDGELEYTNQQLSLTLSPNSQVRLEQLSHQSLNQPIERVKLQLPRGLQSHLDLTSFPNTGLSDLAVKPPSLTLTASKIRLPDLTLQLSPIQLSPKQSSSSQLKPTALTPANSALAMQVRIDSINSVFDDKPLPGFALDASINLAGLQLENSQLESPQLDSRFQIQGTNNPLQLNGSVKGKLDGVVRSQWQLKPVSLKRLLPLAEAWVDIPPELSLEQGTLFHRGSAKWQNQRLRVQAKQSIEQATLLWDETLFEQLEWHSQSTLDPSGIFADKGKVKLAKVKTGVEITDTQASYIFEHNNGRNLMQITEGVARLLEGEVRLAPTRFDPLAPDVDTQISLDKLDLGAILNLEQQEGLSGQGKLSGNLPLTFKNNALSIADGALQGLAPGGRISFLATPAVLAYAAGNTGLKIALEALENFHFETLDITLNYLKDGTAQFNTRLKGNNPDWNDGHPVDFTINIEENIPKLLQTLQFTDKLTESIEKRYR